LSGLAYECAQSGAQFGGVFRLPLLSIIELSKFDNSEKLATPLGRDDLPWCPRKRPSRPPVAWYTSRGPVDWEPFSNKTHGSLPGEAVGGAEEDLGRPAPGEGHEAHAFLEVAVAGQEFESRQIPSRQGSKGRCSGGKEVVAFPSLARAFSCGSCTSLLFVLALALSAPAVVRRKKAKLVLVSLTLSRQFLKLRIPSGKLITVIESS
jgi:hypothetical protein